MIIVLKKQVIYSPKRQILYNHDKIINLWKRSRLHPKEKYMKHYKWQTDLTYTVYDVLSFTLY